MRLPRPHLETLENLECEPPPLSLPGRLALEQHLPPPPHHSLPPRSKSAGLSRHPSRPPSALPLPNIPRPEENPPCSTESRRPPLPPHNSNELHLQPPESPPFHPNGPRGVYRLGC